MRMANVALRVDGVWKSFRRHAWGDVFSKTHPWWGGSAPSVLEDLNLQVGEGEVFGLLGLNGAGKTTLIKLFLGLLKPTKGSLFVLGKRAGDVETRQGVSYLPEVPYFSRFATPWELLWFFAALYRLPRREAEQKIEEALTWVGLWEKRRVPLKGFSKGMLQRVGMAQLLINDPQVVFLDEPTYGLDVLATRQMRDLILRLKQEGRTVFLNSHQMTEAERVCDRVAVLHQGRLQYVGPVQTPLEDFFVKTIGVSTWA